jgi:uncharacterized oxidoreductase
LSKQPHVAIVNISSGLGYVPLAIVPVYSATKAALISFSSSLRHQLKDTNIQVFDVAPPIVYTDLDKGAREKRVQTDRGIQSEQVAKETIEGIAANKFNIDVGMVKILKIGSRIMPKIFF